MFLRLFTELRQAKVPVSLKEYLTLLEAMDREVIDRSPEDFYYLSRAALVKDERDLDKFDRVVQISVFALVPDLHRTTVTRAFLTDAHAFRVVAAGAEGGRTAGADPLVSAGVAALLLLEALLQFLHQLVETAERLDLRLLLIGEEAVGEALQPVVRDVVRLFSRRFEALEDVAENPVELVEVALVLHQRRAREVVEFLRRALDHLAVHRF